MRKEGHWIDPSIPDDPLFVNIYQTAEKGSSFTCYEDDGLTTAYQQGEFGETVFTLKKRQKNIWELRIGKVKGDYSGKAKERKFVVTFFLQKKKPEEILIGNKKIMNTNNPKKDLPHYWYYNNKGQLLSIHVQIKTDQDTNLRITK